MDIGTIIKADKLAAIELKHPITGAATGVFFEVYGRHSQIFRDKMNANINARQAANAAISKGGGNPPPLTIEVNEAENREVLAVCVHNWYEKTADPKLVKPVIEYNGKEEPYSFETALAIFNDPNCRWITEQIDAAISKLENFTNA